MAENLIIHTGSKEEKYRELLPQLHSLVSTGKNSYWVRFKALLPALASALAEEFAELPGKKPAH